MEDFRVVPLDLEKRETFSTGLSILSDHIYHNIKITILTLGWFVLVAPVS